MENKLIYKNIELEIKDIDIFKHTIICSYDNIENIKTITQVLSEIQFKLIQGFTLITKSYKENFDYYTGLLPIWINDDIKEVAFTFDSIEEKENDN